jgi:hypothetical protein
MQAGSFAVRKWDLLVGAAPVDEDARAQTIVHVPKSVSLRVESMCGEHAGRHFLDHIAVAALELSRGERQSHQPPTIEVNTGLAVHREDTDAGVRVRAEHSAIDATPLIEIDVADYFAARCSLTGAPVVQISRSGYLGAARAIDIVGNVTTVAAMTGHGVSGWPLAVVVRDGEAFLAELRWMDPEQLDRIGIDVTVVPVSSDAATVEALRRRPEWSIIMDHGPWRDVPRHVEPEDQHSDPWRTEEWFFNLLPIGDSVCRLVQDGDYHVKVERAGGTSRSFDDIFEALESLGGTVHECSWGECSADLYSVGRHYLVRSRGPEETNEKWHEFGPIAVDSAIAVTDAIAMAFG